MNSKSNISNQLSSYPFDPMTNQQSNATLIQPKSVKDWVLKNDLNKTLTEGNLTSSLMKKANEQNLANNGDTSEDQMHSTMHVSGMHQAKLPNGM